MALLATRSIATPPPPDGIPDHRSIVLGLPSSYSKIAKVRVEVKLMSKYKRHPSWFQVEHSLERFSINRGGGGGRVSGGIAWDVRREK